MSPEPDHDDGFRRYVESLEPDLRAIYETWALAQVAWKALTGRDHTPEPTAGATAATNTATRSTGRTSTPSSWPTA